MDEKKRARLLAAVTPQGLGGSLQYRATPKPTTVPDWLYWPAERIVEGWQAIALSLNIEPDSLDITESDYIVNLPDVAEFDRRRGLLMSLPGFATRLPLSQCAALLTQLPMPPEMKALAEQAVNPASQDSSLTGAQEKAAPPAPVVTDADGGVQVKPWLIADPRDPDPEQPWYTPARYYARTLCKETPSLLAKKAVLAEKTARLLSAAGFKKRGGIKPLEGATVLKALVNIVLG